MLKLIKRTGQENWIARGTIGGKRIERSTGTAVKRIAERVLRELETAAQSGEPEQAPLFAEVLTNYIRQGGEKRFLPRILDYFGMMRLDQVNSRTMRDAAAALYPTATAATIRRQLYVPVIAIMNQAEEDEIWTAPRLKAPKVTTKQMRAAGQEWFAAVLPECNAKLVAVLLFMATTGWRVTETIEADLDLIKGEAFIPRTKTGEPKRVLLSQTVIVAIANAGGSFGYKTRNGVRKALQAACDRAGIEYLTPHQVGRHTFASNLLAAGKSLKFVQDAGGWKSGRLVMDTYGHLEQSDVMSESKVLGENWGKEVMEKSK